MCRGWRLCLIGALVLLRAASGEAQVSASARLALDWSAPPDCPTRDAVLQALDRLRAPSPFADRRRAPEMSATVAVVRRDEGRWLLDVQTVTRGATSQRRLVASTCAQAADAASLILALALDVPPPVEVPAPLVAPLSPLRSRASRVRFALRGSLALDIGVLPAPAAGLDLTVALLWRRLRVEASFAYWFDRRAVNGDGLGGDVSLVAGALRGCYVLRRGTIEPRLCGAVEGGAMRGRSVGLSTVGAGASPWWGLFAGAALAWRVTPRLALQVAVDAGVPLSSPDFVIGGAGVVHRPAAVTFRGAIGVEWRFL